MHIKLVVVFILFLCELLMLTKALILCEKPQEACIEQNYDSKELPPGSNPLRVTIHMTIQVNLQFTTVCSLKYTFTYFLGN
jgi:hypothetical protein